jgi:iron(III) transport system substrate-binding protein
MPSRLASLAALLLLLAGPAAAAAPLTLYSAQHQQMVDQVTAAFTKETGIPVRVHSGEGPEVAAQLLREGAASPADVYFTENTPELVLLDEHGLLGKVAPATLARVPAKYSAPDGTWLGVLARENVLLWAPSKIKEDALPASVLDLAKPEWKGRIAIAPGDADFQPLVGAVVALKGREAALDWLRGLKANAQIFDDEEGVVSAVERGSIAAGLANNYYWARMHAESGGKSASRLHHFAGGDAGGIVNVSGAAVLKSSRQPEEAQRFLAFLVSAPVQRMLAEGSIDFEYPLVAGVAANPLLTPMDRLQPPSIALSALGDDQGSAALLREAGLI